MPRPSTRPHATRPKDRRSQWVHAEQKWPIRLGQDGGKVIGIKRAMCLTDGSPRITVSANLNPLIAPGAASDRRYDAVHLGRSSRFARRKMPIGQTGELYRSLGGDRWSLCRKQRAAAKPPIGQRRWSFRVLKPGRTFAGMLTPPSKPPLIGLVGRL